MIKKFSLWLVLLALCAHTIIISAQTGETEAARIAGTILVRGQAMNYAEQLADGFGARLTGSPSYARAAEWAAAEFRNLGIKDVRLEPFTLPHGWVRGNAQARITAPITRELRAEALGWAPPTPAAGIKGEVVIVSEITAEQIRAQSDRIRNHIVLLDTEKINAAGAAAAYSTLLTAYRLLTDAGALAIIRPARTNNNVINAMVAVPGGQIAPLPMIEIGLEDVKLITRQLKHAAVTIELNCASKVTDAIEVNNVVAQLRGREKPDEWIVIGAHLDSWDFATGAQDNGTGCAMVLEAARAIMALNQAPRRSMRFILWGGEEQAKAGSAAYVRAHKNEIDRCIAVLNTDHGAGHPRGWRVEGRSEVADALRPLSQSLLALLNGSEISLDTTFDTDHAAFIIEGVPALDLWVDDSQYFEIHHQAGDTIDKVNAHNLALGAAVVAVTAYTIAEQPAPIAPHQNRAGVEALLKRTGLFEYAKAQRFIEQ